MSAAIVLFALIVALLLFVSLAIMFSINRQQNRLDAILHDDLLRQAIEQGALARAVRRYRWLTGLSEEIASRHVREWIENPDSFNRRKSRHNMPEPGAGVRDLLAAGDVDGAVKLYAQFTGVDQFTARDAIRTLQHEIQLEEMEEDLRRLLRLGDKAAAIEAYQRATDADLAEALDAIETLELKQE